MKDRTDGDAVEAYTESNNQDNRDLAIEERQRQVASLLAQSRTEAEIAAKLKISQQLILKEVKHPANQS